MFRGTMLGALAIVSALGIVAPEVHASTGYRYWSYWNAAPETDSWVYATEGSGTHVPDDGAVEGWRFGIAGDATSIQPKHLPDFDAVCGQVPAPDDGKRVAVVIDPGNLTEAPAGETPTSWRGECVIAGVNATGLQVLQSITDVRLDAGFVCGIDGYPSKECAPLVDSRVTSIEVVEATELNEPTEVKAPAETAEAEQEPSSVSTDTTSIGSPLITAAFLSLLAVVGFGLWRRSRRSTV